MSSTGNFQKLFDKQIWSRHSKRWYDFLNLIHTVSFKLLSDYKKRLFCVWTSHRLHWKNTVVSNFNFDWLEWDLHRREANTCMKFIQGIRQFKLPRKCETFNWFETVALFTLSPHAGCMWLLSCDFAVLYSLNLHKNPNNSAHVLHKQSTWFFFSLFQKLHVISISGP